VAASVDALRPCRTIYVFPAAFIIGWAKRSESAKSRPIIRHADRLAGLFVATQDGSPLPDGTLVSIPEQTIGARSSTIRSARPLAVGIFTTCRRGRCGRSGSRPRIKRLEATRPPKDAIRQFIEEIIQRSLSDPERRGCLLINSALEIAPHDRELGAIIGGCLAEIEAFFRRSIKAAQKQGSVRTDFVAKDVARLLLGVVLGIRVLARARPERALLEGVARPALGLLD
jgi:AcrR family transcriptional regulator